MIPRRRSKYGAVPTVVDGMRFDSASEAKRWCDLRLRERIGEISDLRRQVSYVLRSQTGAPIGKIVVDYVYVEGGQTIAEDRKGFITDLAKWKLNHLAADHDVTVRITKTGAKDAEVPKPGQKRRAKVRLSA